MPQLLSAGAEYRSAAALIRKPQNAVPNRSIYDRSDVAVRKKKEFEFVLWPRHRRVATRLLLCRRFEEHRMKLLVMEPAMTIKSVIGSRPVIVSPAIAKHVENKRAELELSPEHCVRLSPYRYHGRRSVVLSC